MKSAMQELWEYIDANIHEEGFNLYAAKEISLEKEKKQILDFTRRAVRKILDEDRSNPFNLEEYYNQTYNK